MTKALSYDDIESRDCHYGFNLITTRTDGGYPKSHCRRHIQVRSPDGHHRISPINAFARSQPHATCQDDWLPHKGAELSVMAASVLTSVPLTTQFDAPPLRPPDLSPVDWAHSQYPNRNVVYLAVDQQGDRRSSANDQVHHFWGGAEVSALNQDCWDALQRDQPACDWRVVSVTIADLMPANRRKAEITAMVAVELERRPGMLQTDDQSQACKSEVECRLAGRRALACRRRRPSTTPPRRSTASALNRAVRHAPRKRIQTVVASPEIHGWRPRKWRTCGRCLRRPSTAPTGRCCFGRDCVTRRMSSRMRWGTYSRQTARVVAGSSAPTHSRQPTARNCASCWNAGAARGRRIGTGMWTRNQGSATGTCAADSMPTKRQRRSSSAGAASVGAPRPGFRQAGQSARRARPRTGRRSQHAAGRPQPGAGPRARRARHPLRHRLQATQPGCPGSQQGRARREETGTRAAGHSARTRCCLTGHPQCSARTHCLARVAVQHIQENAE